MFFSASLLSEPNLSGNNLHAPKIHPHCSEVCALNSPITAAVQEDKMCFGLDPDPPLGYQPFISKHLVTMKERAEEEA